MLFNLFTPSYPVVDVNIPEGWWKSDSQLDIDFANNRSFNRKTAYKGRPDDMLTYTSPSPKMVFSENGILKYARHNLLTYSQEFDNAAWTKNASSISATNITAPDDTATAELFVSDTNNAIHYLFVGSPPSITSGVTYTGSVFLKKGTGSTAPDWMQLSLSSATFGSTQYANFNLTTGEVGAVGSGATATIEDVGGGWYRCSITATATSTSGGSLLVVFTNDNNALGRAPNYVGVTTSNVCVWGAQLNLGSSALTYVPTTSAAVYSLPIDHDPITHAPLGVLIEEQRTNLLTYSEEFDNAAWTKAAVTITANSTIAPNGASTADRIVGDGTLSTHGAREEKALTGNCVLSAYLKQGTDRYATLYMLGRSPTHDTSCYVHVDLQDKVILITGVGVASSSITDVGDGWLRVAMVKTGTWTSSVNTEIRIETSNSASYANNTTTGYIYAWGAQLEAGAFPTSYIPTVASQVTRAADQVSILTSAFGYNASEGTLAVETRVNEVTGNRIVSLYGPTSRLADIYLTSDPSVVYYKTSDASQLQIGIGVVVQTPFKVCLAYKLNDYNGAYNGTLGGADTSTGTLPTDTNTLGIGNWNNTPTGFLNGHIKRLTYFPTRKTNAELQGLTI